MRIKIIISSVVVILLTITLTVVLVYYLPESTEYEPDPSHFTSSIRRNYPEENYLAILSYFENLTGQAVYFDDLENDSRNMVLNMTYYIKKELKYVEELNTSEYEENSFRYHNFTYVGSLYTEINRSVFLSIYNVSSFHPIFMFYYNFTSTEYRANSSISTWIDPQDWMISDIVDFLYKNNSTFILITQYVKISDIYAPLAGTGTEFERFILCLETGQPVLFISNEGPWWIS